MSYELGLRRGALVAILVIMTVGAGIFVKVLLGGVVQGRAAVFSLNAPGGANFALEHPGAYTIFAEYGRTLDSQGMARPAGIEWLEVSVRRADGEAELSLTPIEEADPYAIRRRLREPLYTFRAESPGAFRIEAAYPPDEPGPPVHLMLSQSYEGQVAHAFGEGIGVLAMTAVLVLLVVKLGRRVPAADSAASRPV